MAQAAGGVDRYIRMLLKYLDKEKFENILVCSQDFNREDYDGLVDSFEQIEMNRAIGVSDLNSIKEVRRLIKKYNPDAFYFTLNSVELNEIVASQSSILFFGVSTIIGYYYYSKEKEIDTKTQLLYNMQIFNRETGAMSQLAESSTKQWRLADTFVCGRGVPIGKFVRPYLHFKGKEQGRIDLTLTL